MTDTQIKESNEEKDYAEDCSGEVMTEVVRYVFSNWDASRRKFPN